MTKRMRRVTILAAVLGLVGGSTAIVTPTSAGLVPSGGPTVVDQTPLVYYYDVAYNPERDEYLGVYLVGTGAAAHLNMVRLDADGAVLSGPKVAVPARPSPRELSSSSVGAPRVVYNAAQNQYMVAFLRNDGGHPNPADNRSSSVFGRLISDVGVVVGGEAKLATTVADNTACQFALSGRGRRPEHGRLPAGVQPMARDQRGRVRRSVAIRTQERVGSTDRLDG